MAAARDVDNQVKSYKDFNTLAVVPIQSPPVPNCDGALSGPLPFDAKTSQNKTTRLFGM
jgi:hypothetical protein